jgi:acyl-CoA reductase-like NAD-dependent aldehyde dehydrogenase
VGGSIHNELNNTGGTFYEPTVLVDMNETMPPFYEESFGPIAPLMSFANDDEALSIANNTRYLVIIL